MTWWIGLLAAGFVAGLVLLVVGLRGRRVGDEPRCRKCNYELTGLSADRCPECGHTIAPESTIYGHRHRRRPVWMAGLVLLVLSVSAGGYRTYTWAKGLQYRDYPVFVLTWLGAGGDRNALFELQSRVRSKKLAPEELHDFFPTVLDRFRRADENMERIKWLEMVNAIHAPGVLSEQECRDLYDAGARVGWRWRPRVRLGETLRFWNDQRIWMFGYGAYDQLTVHRGIAEGDKLISDYKPRDWNIKQRCFFNMSEHHNIEMDRPPGKYEFMLSVKKVFYRVENGQRTPAFTVEQQTVATVEVLPADAPDTVTLVKNPEFAEMFKEAIVVSFPIADMTGRVEEGFFTVDVGADMSVPIPMDAVFGLRLESEDHKLWLGPFEFRDNWPNMQQSYYPYPIEKLRPGVEYTPVLRPSVKHARLTPDIFEIWDGVLKYEPITRESLEREAARVAKLPPVSQTQPALPNLPNAPPVKPPTPTK